MATLSDSSFEAADFLAHKLKSRCYDETITSIHTYVLTWPPSCHSEARAKSQHLSANLESRGISQVISSEKS